MIYDNEYARARLEKRRKLMTGGGVPPYPALYSKTHGALDVKSGYPQNEGQEVVVAGRVVLLRLMGKASFATLRDQTGDIQVYLKSDTLGAESYERVKSFLDLGDFIGVRGKVFKTKTGEISVAASSWQFLSKSILSPPEKWHGLTDIETRYRKRHVDLFVNLSVRQDFERRAKMIRAIREFYAAAGFIEVETPSMSSRAGGAAAKPFKTHHNALDIDLFLRVAPELHLKRLLVGGFEKVFEIGKNFRNEGVSTRHNPEFTMLESYEAYADAALVMEFTERLLRHVAHAIHGSDRFTSGGQEYDLGRPFERVTYLDAISRALDFKVAGDTELRPLCAAARRKIASIAEDASWETIVESSFDALVEPGLQKPTFVVRHPRRMSPLAKACADDPLLADRFELYVGGQEIANAYSEQNDPVEQMECFQEQARGDDGKIDWDFLEALSYGMPPAGGLGIGVDRLFMLFCDLPSIRDAILFPLLRPEK